MPRIDIIDSASRAKALWDKFSSNQSLYDEWEFRSLFVDSDYTDPVFYTIKQDGEVIAVLPMQESYDDDDEQYLEFYGGLFMEHNRVLCRPKHRRDFAPLLCARALEDEAMLYSMPGEYSDIPHAVLSDPSYSLDLMQFDSENADEMILRHLVPNKDRSTVRRLLRENIPDRVGYADDLDRMIEMSDERFGDDSWFEEYGVYEGFCNLLESSYETHLLSLLVDGVAQSVSLGVIHKNSYHFMLSASNWESLSGIGKLHIFLIIREAINRGCKRFEAGIGDCGWKDRWNLRTTPLYDIGGDGG